MLLVPTTLVTERLSLVPYKMSLRLFLALTLSISLSLTLTLTELSHWRNMELLISQKNCHFFHSEEILGNLGADSV